MYSKIVVPLDGSELAEGVLPHVAEVIRGRGSQVCLLTVAQSARVTTSVLPDLFSSFDNTQEERQRVEQELTAYLETVAGRLEPTAAQVQASVRFGRPADEILAFAGEAGADLIAMSTHGRSGISRWVLGSVADRVLHGAMCPVLIVRAKPQQIHPAYQHILVPLDGSELAEQVLPHVSALIRPNHTRVYLISVLANGFSDRTITLLTSSPPGLQLSTTALSKAEVQLTAYLRSVAAVLRERGATVHTAVKHGSPAEEILTHAAEVNADLIGMTAHGLSGVSRWMYGNVASKVLQGSHCSVLLVHPPSD
ncbi:MAG: universal stress protein [Anaerolineae bacterium]|nr:universal stress protein [Anaerolineae bacterium]